MKFNDAYDLIMGIHEQCGDKHGWANMKDEAKFAFEAYDTFKAWERNLRFRTNISDDMKWECECFNASFEVLFALKADRDSKGKV